MVDSEKDTGQSLCEKLKNAETVLYCPGEAQKARRLTDRKRGGRER